MAAPPEVEGAVRMAAPPEVEEPLSRGFSEEQFGAACRELDQPAPGAAGPWQLLVETMGVRIYRLYHEQSGLYEYKIFGGLADVSPKLCVDVYMDLDFRKEWDQYVKGASSTAPAGEEEKLFPWVTADLQGIPTEAWFGIYYIGKESPIWSTVLALSMRLSVYSGLTFKNLALEDIERLRHKSAVKEENTTVTVKVNHLSGSHSSLLQALSQQEFILAQPHGSSELYEETYDGEKVIYWEVKYPFPLSNRDYVYIRECREMDVHGRKIWVVLAKSVAVPQCPEKPGIIRVKSYKQSLVIESDGKAGCKVYMYYFDNPGGMIPSWLVNWAAKSGVPAFLKDIQKACLIYSKTT